MIKIAICDDHIEELNLLSALLKRYISTKLADMQIWTYQGGFPLLEALERGQNYDIVILDIIMPGENGIEVAREIRQVNTKLEIIFLTSSPEFALESYEVNANNYLLKPVSEEKLFVAMDHCLGHIKKNESFGFILHNKANQYTRILYSKILYAEAMRKSVNLYLTDHTVISSVMTFTELEKLLLAQPCFMKPHRSYVVNMNCIDHITKTEIVLISGDRIPLPKSRYPDVSKTFFDFAFSNSFGEGGSLDGYTL